MKSAFIDSSVLFSASMSKTGASALIMAFCRKGKLQGYISPYVIVEVKRNIALENQTVKQRFNIFLLQSKLKIMIPTDTEIKSCENIIKSKDAHVVAATIKSKVDYLITLDKKDFMQKKVREFVSPIIITAPKKFLKTEKLLI